MLINGNYICPEGCKWCNDCEHFDDCPDARETVNRDEYDGSYNEDMEEYNER